MGNPHKVQRRFTIELVMPIESLIQPILEQRTLPRGIRSLCFSCGVASPNQRLQLRMHGVGKQKR